MDTVAPREQDLTEQKLRTAAERAGYALACSFSTSEEYEADLIAERRAQGKYGRPQHREAIVGWLMLGSGVAALTLVFLLI
ncbi:hypothetical protein GJW-30_1_03058 [Variibacter gotjawalensis]|jgi:hypothetical protein|uniref:Uncharacterized protein n=1 Tax=Variibacter gotjawalensis TaxID=1333996 RepID=A0A0S3PX59_9BRAD|nr:hypothetical protein [Variibacter gotjawalensis]NIK46343.1 hypothetical protein [Variibacter gotjawalensis]RZS48253.1 hypothetical protein EV661_0660 [Variibacter gotjawalensis]BAT60513.1 hypothetical protein GJW-30_1_03058 [Variibacter gotjawalensis]